MKANTPNDEEAKRMKFQASLVFGLLIIFVIVIIIVSLTGAYNKGWPLR